MSTRPGQLHIRCAGELDLSVAHKLQEAIEWSHTPALAALRLDMSELGFMDSSGLRCLITADQWCNDHGVELESLPSPAVQRLLDVTGAVFTVTAPEGAG